MEIRRVLTGFKYIGDQIASLEAEGHPERFLLGFEESYGYLSGGYVRDVYKRQQLTSTKFVIRGEGQIRG